MKTIQVRDINFWGLDDPITAQVFQDDIMIYCNHANAQEETVHNQIDRVDQPDICWTSNVLTCDKCGAYKLPGDNYWEEV